MSDDDLKKVPAPLSDNEKHNFIEHIFSNGRSKAFTVGTAIIVTVAIVIATTVVVNYIMSRENHVEAVQNAQVDVGRAGLTPATLQIKSGSDVTWTNSYKGSYELISDSPNAFSADVQIDVGSSFTATFNQTGTYHYHIVGSPNVKGTVIVN